MQTKGTVLSTAVRSYGVAESSALRVDFVISWRHAIPARTPKGCAYAQVFSTSPPQPQNDTHAAAQPIGTPAGDYKSPRGAGRFSRIIEDES